MIIKYAYTVYEKEEDRKMVLKPCYMLIDKDGDFVDACSGKLMPSTLDNALERVKRTHPDNAPFRIVKWTGYGFVEVTSVT